jgi:hypothetical protein
VTADIEREIGRTRNELATTLEALEHKLAARHLVEKGFDMFKDSLGNDFGVNRSLEFLRNNPVPIALIGIGAAWLIASNSGVVERIAQDERIDAARRRVTDLASDIGNRAGELASSVAERVGLSGDRSAAGAMSEQPLGHTGSPIVDQEAGRRSSNGWMHQMADMAQGAMRTARDSGGAVLNRASSLAGDGAGRVADQFGDAFERHPLAIGAIGIMAGALLAALLPTTRLEDEWLGDTRDELWQRAEDAGREAVSRVREVAVRAADAAADAAAETVKTETEKSDTV